MFTAKSHAFKLMVSIFGEYDPENNHNHNQQVFISDCMGEYV